MAAHSIAGEGRVQTTSLTSPQKQHCVPVEEASLACVFHSPAAFKVLEENEKC